MYYVYLHIKQKDGNPFYIGKGKINTNRYKSHHGRNLFWKNTVEKYGFDTIIICTDLSDKEACDLEKYWIKRIGRRDLGLGRLVNLTDGGDGISGRIIPIEQRMYGEKNGFYGKKHTDETKQMVSLANKNRVWKDSSRKKLSESIKGKSIHSKENIEKLRIKMTGDKNPMFNKKHSIESREKMSKTRKGKSVGGMLLLDTSNGIYYDNIASAARFNGYTKSTLTAMISGKFKNKSPFVKA